MRARTITAKCFVCERVEIGDPSRKVVLIRQTRSLYPNPEYPKTRTATLAALETLAPRFPLYPL